jgi:glycosyltransferase involved in cell wall biosynthesis
VKPVKVLHVIPRLSVGGVENQLSLVLRHYDGSSLSPLVCCLDGEDEIGREIEAAGTPVIYLNKLGHRFDWTIVRDIRRVIGQNGVTIVRTHQYHANLYGRLAARLARVPCIVASVHNVYTIDRKLHRRILNRFLARFTDRVIAVSLAVKEDIVRYDALPPDKVSVIYNGIDRARFSAKDTGRARYALGIAPNIPVLGTIGRLTPQKGQRYLLDAVAELRKRHDRILLLIVGDGPLREDLERQVGALDIGDHVVFLGIRRDVPELLAAMDIFVLPSLWEGLGNSLIEAMAAGKPIIATDIPPIKEVVTSEGVGVLVPPKDEATLVSAIDSLLRDRAHADRLGAAARELVCSSFDLSATVKAYTDLFCSILSRKGIDMGAGRGR